MYIKKEVKKKNIIIIVLVLLLLSVAFNFLVYMDTGYCKKVNKINLKTNDEIEWGIDDISIDRSLKIRGWATIPGEEIVTAEYHVILRSVNNNYYIIVPTQIDGRTDITKKYNDGIDYTYSGFLANIKKSKLDLLNDKYEIIINYKNNNEDYYVETDKYLQ